MPGGSKTRSVATTWTIAASASAGLVVHRGRDALGLRPRVRPGLWASSGCSVLGPASCNASQGDPRAMPVRVRANRDVLTRVLGHVSDDELVALTQRLVRIPSVFRPGDPEGNERAVAPVVAEGFRAQGFPVLVEEVAPGRPNVVASLEGATGGSTLVLEGHTDVV